MLASPLWHYPPAGDLVPNTRKFPSGMKALADYVHQRGLKLGLYTDVGTKTCGGQPGSYQHECQDAKLFAEWGVDWLKEDHCSLPKNDDIDKFYLEWVDTRSPTTRLPWPATQPPSHTAMQPSTHSSARSLTHS